jgi:murein DD-endopeptidase MepM/ murein hydrolase activator NlpD
VTSSLYLVICLASPAAGASGPAATASVPSPAVTARPGSVVRWPAPAGVAITSCSTSAATFLPLADACLVPIDLEAEGTLSISRRLASGAVEKRVIAIGAYDWPTERVTVDEKYVAPPAAALQRIARDQARAGKAFALRTARRFSLPLGAPLAELPEAGRFGARRFFNGEARSPHSGADYRAATGTPVFAVADGVVAIAEDQYFPGNSVFVDHGDGLISMAFHLSSIAVAEGDVVKRGQLLGKVGATGRVTGPHLHLGLRWRGAKIDPSALLAPLQALTELH